MWASLTRPPRRFCRTHQALGEGVAAEEERMQAVCSWAQPSLDMLLAEGCAMT